MRCPKCGESFQVERAGVSVEKPLAPVLGAALGLGSRSKALDARPEPAGLPETKEALRPPVPRRDSRQTMLGVAPQAAPTPPRIELSQLDDEFDDLSDGLEMDLTSARSPSSEELDLPGLPEAEGLPDLREKAQVFRGPSAPVHTSTPSPWDAPESLSFDLPMRAAQEDPGLPSLSGDLPDVLGIGRSPADLPDLAAGLPDLGSGLPDVGPALPDLGALPPSQVFGADSGTERGPRSIELPESSLPPPPAGGFERRPLVPSLTVPEDRESTRSHVEVVPARQSPLRDEFLGNGSPGASLSAPSRGLGSGSALGAEDEFDAFPTENSNKMSEPRQGGAGGGAGYGEVALDGDFDDLALGDEIERPRAPEPVAAASSSTVDRGTAGPGVPLVRQKSVGVSRKTKIVASVGLLGAVLGGSLAALPEVGPFGAYVALDVVRARDYQAALGAEIDAARRRVALDTVLDFDAAFRLVERGLGDAPRYKPRKAYAAYLGLLRQLRFGVDGKTAAEAKVLLASLAEAQPSDVEYLALAREAALAVERGPELLARAQALMGRSAEGAGLVGEVAIRARNAKLAIEAWQDVAKSGPTARSEFGLARAYWLLGDRAQAMSAAQGALQKNNLHVGARLLMVELTLDERSRDEELIATLTTLSQAKEASSSERSQALTLLGDLHLTRSRIKQAESSFASALGLDAGNAFAQRGLADALFDSGRFAEALARYEAASRSSPQDLRIQLGIVRAKLRLEQYEDASKLLGQLAQNNDPSTALEYWMGRAKEAIGDKEAARAAYERAVKIDSGVSELVESYVALTRVLSQEGRHAEAEAAVAQARQRFPQDPRVFRALGELASSRGSFEDAVSNYERALALDPDNIGLKFARGVALRQARRFEEARAALDEVEKLAGDYPGLALERGNLFEASGRSDEALRAYESALAQAPTDPDLKLRVGCGKAQAGMSQDAIRLLNEVMEERPSSAEVSYCLGVAIFKEGKDLPKAKRTLERALGFDATRAVYHLYVGWVALEMKDYAAAARFLDKAIELDQTMGDAYWQRGVLRVRQGAVEDAERDLRRALELSPTRYEARAALAEAYLQLGRENDALLEFEHATKTGTVDPFVQYRYGKVLYDNRRAGEAKGPLEQAIERVKGKEDSSPWVWDAHRYLAMALGRSREALVHWEAFIDHAPTDSPYRGEAVRAMRATLAALGR